LALSPGQSPQINEAKYFLMDSPAAEIQGWGLNFE